MSKFRVVGRIRGSARPLARLGFTLIELLVVVAIIALLISILLPSLGSARGQARATQCATRVSQLTKALLLYADDFNETPPFTGIGWEDIHYTDQPGKDLGTTSAGPGDIPTRSKYDWAILETWVTQKPDLLWNGTLPQDQWAQNGVGISTGTLFPYSRFENLYRCPDFERITDPLKSQSAFNYTRSILGRKWIMGPIAVGGPESDYWGRSYFGAPGPILRTSQVYAPSNHWMLLDEWWRLHVAAPMEEHAPPRSELAGGGWSATDCVFFVLGDEIGGYHGTPVQNQWFRPQIVAALDDNKISRGYITCMDGHAELQREFWANKYSRNTGDLVMALPDILRWLSSLTYAQRGKVIRDDITYP
jgi:prepilin-type N-terminal cleavage/methylation domain-containing protein